MAKVAGKKGVQQSNHTSLLRTILLALGGVINQLIVATNESGGSKGEVALIDIKGDAVTPLDDCALLLIRAEANDDLLVHLMYPDGTENTIEVWKLKANCTCVIKIFDTGTTLQDEYMYVSKV